MFKNFDTRLLLRFPLLWNTKFPYIIITGILFHILAFFIGFQFNDFKKNLSDIHEAYFNDNSEMAIMAVGIIGCVIILVWFIFYIRNNGFKSFYPKKKNDLFKEWLIVFSILLFFSMAFFSVQYGNRFAAKSAFTENAIAHNAEIAYKGRLLMMNNDENKERQGDNYLNEKDSTYYWEDNETFIYKDREYPWRSMIANRDNEVFFEVQDNRDSIYTDEVRMLFYKNDSVGIRKILDQYFELLKEHKLRTNLTAKRWFGNFYTPPYYQSNASVDDGSNYMYSDNGDVNLNRGLFVDSYVLKGYYGRLLQEKGKSWTFDYEQFLAILYLALGLSLVIIVFRISSLLQWFISLVTIFIIGLITISLQDLSNDDVMDFRNILIALFLEIIIVLLLVFAVRHWKKISSVSLNILILVFPFFIPVVAAVVYKGYSNISSYQLEIFYSEGKYYSNDRFLMDAGTLNLGVIFLGMFMLLRYVRNVKALPGN